MKLPESLKTELAQWNDGDGISLEAWTDCSGNFDLAVGYCTLFWPEFEVVGDYLLVKGHSKENIESFEGVTSPLGVEWVLNHIHIADLHCRAEPPVSVQHCLILGNTLKEIYAAKLAVEFPDRPCEVEFYIPEDADDLQEYQVSFWQKKWEDTSHAVAGPQSSDDRGSE